MGFDSVSSLFIMDDKVSPDAHHDQGGSPVTEKAIRTVAGVVFVLLWSVMLAAIAREAIARPVAYFDVRTGECAWVEPPEHRCDDLPPLTGRRWARPGGFR